MSAPNNSKVLCIQPEDDMLVALVPASFNGSPGDAEIFPIQNVTISECDFGHPANVANPYFLFNAQAIQLKNVRIGEQVLNTVLSA